MRVESGLGFEPIEQVYARVYQVLKPRATLPTITVYYREYANPNSRIRLEEGHLVVDISDLLRNAPASIQEALAFILIEKLFRRRPSPSVLALYRRYLNRADVRQQIYRIKQERGRKTVLDPKGRVYDLCEVFEELNLKYFYGLMARPRLGWSVRKSRTILGHYDPSHHVIVLTNVLDSPDAPELIVQYVMFHEMLHLKYPTQHKGQHRRVHTPDFKAAEKKFERFREAQQALRLFLQGSGKQAD